MLPDTTLDLILSFLASVGGRQDCQSLLVSSVDTATIDQISFLYMAVGKKLRVLVHVLGDS
jgi:hypothetical protein